jgi:hypothetical protein
MKELIATICLGAIILGMLPLTFGIYCLFFPIVDGDAGDSVEFGKLCLGFAALLVLPSLGWFFWQGRGAE